MDLNNKKRRNKYDRVMSRVKNQSRSSLKSSPSVIRHEIPSSVRIGAKPSVSNLSSSVYSELPTVLNDYIPETSSEQVKRTFVVKPRKTIKSLDPALSPHRTAGKTPEVRKKDCNLRSQGSVPLFPRSSAGVSDKWFDSHVRNCFSSRSHKELKELKDEIKAYDETDKFIKLRSRLYKSCGVVLDDVGEITAKKAVQVQDLEPDNKEIEMRRQAWLKAVGREDLLSKLDDNNARQQRYRICEDHFEKSCISKNNIKKYLLDNAFPTLNLPTNDGACSSSSQCENVSTQENQTIQFIPITELSLSSNEDLNKIVILKEEKSPSSWTDLDKQNCESISAQSALHLSADTPRTLELQDAKKHIFNLDSVTEKDFLKLCDKFMPESMAQIIKWQIDVKRNGSVNRYSQAFKFFALNLHYSDPAAYRFLSNTFCLPSLVTLQKLVRPIGTKLDERLLCALKTKVDKMGSQEKICSICVDCMSLKPNLFYDVKNDRIVGFHEINGIQIIVPAKYVIVIMIRGIIHNYKQLIAHSFLSQCTNDPEINDWIDEIITSLLNIGLDIRVFISGSDFLSASNSRSVSRNKTYFEVNGHKIYYIFDVPHLVKSVRNNLKTCNFLFDNKVAKWTHIRDVYTEDKKRQIRLAPKLTDIHINPNNFQKMRVKVATQVLSRTVASVIYTYVDLNIVEGGAKDTADFVNKINNLFDLLNSSTLRSPNKYKRAFRGNSYQIEFLKEMLKFFSNLKLIKIDGQKDVTNIMNFIHGFQVTIKSLLQLYEDLKTEKIKFIFTRRLNQDCLENFFDKARKACGNCQEPTCRQVSVEFNKMFIINILKKPHNTSCDQDFYSLLMKTDDYRIFITPSQNSQVSDADHETGSVLTVGTNDYQFNLPKKNGLVYVTGYLYRKCLEQHKCEKIKLYVNRSEQPIKMEKVFFFSHYKDFNEGIVQADFFIKPPDNFIAIVELLEQKFREYFYIESNIVNIGNDILKCVNDCKFDMPCECFPLDYLKKLFIRLRIYHSIKRYNKLLKNKNYNNKIFTVSDL